MVVRSATLRRAVISDKKKNVDKKEINSPKLTMNFLFWICGARGFLLFALLGLTSGGCSDPSEADRHQLNQKDIR